MHYHRLIKLRELTEHRFLVPQGASFWVYFSEAVRFFRVQTKSFAAYSPRCDVHRATNTKLTLCYNHSADKSRKFLAEIGFCWLSAVGCLNHGLSRTARINTDFKRFFCVKRGFREGREFQESYHQKAASIGVPSETLFLACRRGFEVFHSSGSSFR